jgi:predicted phosphodiesterase
MRPQNLLLIGDVHGKYKSYKKIVQKHTGPTLQIGDFGGGYSHDLHAKQLDPSRHKVLFGNHEDFDYLRFPHSVGNHMVWGDLFAVRGAYSQDKYMPFDETASLSGMREDWDPREQLTPAEMDAAFEAYEKAKPRIVVSHDCPRTIAERLFGKENRDRTKVFLDDLLTQHRPELWVFGHWHKARNEVVRGTRFVCLEPLKTLVV